MLLHCAAYCTCALPSLSLAWCRIQTIIIDLVCILKHPLKSFTAVCFIMSVLVENAFWWAGLFCLFFCSTVVVHQDYLVERLKGSAFFKVVCTKTSFSEWSQPEARQKAKKSCVKNEKNRAWKRSSNSSCFCTFVNLATAAWSGQFVSFGKLQILQNAASLIPTSKPKHTDALTQHATSNFLNTSMPTTHQISIKSTNPFIIKIELICQRNNAATTATLHYSHWKDCNTPPTPHNVEFHFFSERHWSHPPFFANSSQKLLIWTFLFI